MSRIIVQTNRHQLVFTKEGVLNIIDDLGPQLQTEGVKIVVADNDAKLHSKSANERWALNGIKV